jgi:predicted metallopeptidase
MVSWMNNRAGIFKNISLLVLIVKETYTLCTISEHIQSMKSASKLKQIITSLERVVTSPQGNLHCRAHNRMYNSKLSC